jgi:LPXTG-motif cell wall-anchored protein
LVVNATQQACAFVSDINACIFLPKGWSPRPTDVPESIWSCNYKYHWVDNVSCLTRPPTPAPLFVDNAPDQGSDWILMIGLGLILLGGVLFWLMRRRVKP